MVSPNSDFDAVLRRMQQLETRLEELNNATRETRETDRRFWARWGPLIYMTMGAALAIALGIPNAVRSRGEVDVNPRVEAQEFVLRDAGGHVRAKLVVSGDLPELTMYDKKGDPATSLTAERPGHKLSTSRPSASAKGPSTRNPEPAVRTAPITGGATLASARPAALPAALSALLERVTTRSAPAQAVRLGQPAGSRALAGPPRPVAFALDSGVTRSGGVTPAGAPDAQTSPIPASPASELSGPATPAESTASLPGAAATLPPVKLTVLGYVEKPGVGREVAVSVNSEVYVTHEGETFAERFKVLRITPTVVEVLDTYTSQSVRLGISP